MVSNLTRTFFAFLTVLILVCVKLSFSATGRQIRVIIGSLDLIQIINPLVVLDIF